MQEYLPIISILILLITAIIFIRVPLLTAFFNTPYRVFANILKALKILKDDSRWSVVYDAQTKLPIDPAYVTVKNLVGVEVASMITDLNGRFGLILPRGLYVINVQKTNYQFPSETLKHAHNDGMYSGLYYGETIEVTDPERAIAVAVPLDPLQTDWNQKEKKRSNLFLTFDNEIATQGAELFYCCIGLAAAAYLYDRTTNYFFFILIAAYVVLLIAILLWRVFEVTTYTHSVIIDRQTKQPLAFARVTIFNASRKIQVMRKVSSFEGQFTALLSTGKYYLTIERRDEQGGYLLVFTSSVFRIRDGYIGKKFTV